MFISFDESVCPYLVAKSPLEAAINGRESRLTIFAAKLTFSKLSLAHRYGY